MRLPFLLPDTATVKMVKQPITAARATCREAARYLRVRNKRWKSPLREMKRLEWLCWK
jgi:hypothetical protein